MLSTDYNRILIFKEPIFNAALTGHIIRTVKVSDDGGCRVMCYMEPNCVSFNVGPSDDGTRTCNLNNATDDSVSPTSLVDRPNFSYNGAEVNFFPSGLLSFLSSFLLSLLFLPSWFSLFSMRLRSFLTTSFHKGKTQVVIQNFGPGRKWGCSKSRALSHAYHIAREPLCTRFLEHARTRVALQVERVIQDTAWNKAKKKLLCLLLFSLVNICTSANLWQS